MFQKEAAAAAAACTPTPRQTGAVAAQDVRKDRLALALSAVAACHSGSPGVAKCPGEDFAYMRTSPAEADIEPAVLPYGSAAAAVLDCTDLLTGHKP